MDEALKKQVALLERTLGRQLELHEQLASLLDRKRAAMRGGDREAMVGLCDLENEKLQAIAELEKRRLQQAADLTLMIEPDAAAPMRLAELAERLEEPMRGRLLVLRGQLRERMEQIRDQSSVARRAAESLVLHVQGILHTLTALSAEAGTYGQRGTVTGGGAGGRINLTA